MAVQPADTLAHLRRQRARRRAAAEQRARELLARLPDAVRSLRERHGATQAWLFGSLASDDFRLEGDVDLAVEGLPPGRYFAALADLMRALQARVDLVRIEDAGESLRERILSEGVAQ